jgi:hypothetical protein
MIRPGRAAQATSIIVSRDEYQHHLVCGRGGLRRTATHAHYIDSATTRRVRTPRVTDKVARPRRRRL